jgi:dihydropteroate synthase
MAPGVRAADGARTSAEDRDRVAHTTAAVSEWTLRDRTLDLGVPTVMGVLNLTPDSFSDGGRHTRMHAALARASELLEGGATILDVGGESTRPGAAPVPDDEERRRVVPFIHEARRRWDAPISIDTRKASVASAALEAGAEIVNDVSGLAHDRAMAAVVRDHRAGLVLMHMRGTPETMGGLAEYGDLMREVRAELATSVEVAEREGVPRSALVIDPGLGFAKTAEHSLEVLGRLDELRPLGRPILVGPSRKSFLGKVLALPTDERVEGTVAACVMAFERGASVFRVHDVTSVVRALKVAHAIVDAERSAR